MNPNKWHELSSGTIIRAESRFVSGISAVYVACIVFVRYIEDIVVELEDDVKAIVLGIALLSSSVLGWKLAKSLEGDEIAPILRGAQLGLYISVPWYSIAYGLSSPFDEVRASPEPYNALLWLAIYFAFIFSFVPYRYEKRFFQRHAVMSRTNRFLIFLPITTIFAGLLLFIAFYPSSL